MRLALIRGLFLNRKSITFTALILKSLALTVFSECQTLFFVNYAEKGGDDDDDETTP